VLTVIYRRVIFRYNGSGGGGDGGTRAKGWKERTAAGTGDRGRTVAGIAAGRGGFGWLRGYQCVSGLQNECPRFLRRGLYHSATIYTPRLLLSAAGSRGKRSGRGRGGPRRRSSARNEHARGGEGMPSLTYLPVRK